MSDQFLHKREARQHVTQSVELSTHMSGGDVESMHDLVEPDNAGQMLQPCAAAAATKSGEGHAGVVHAEPHDGPTQQMTVLQAAVRQSEELFGLDVLAVDDRVGEAGEVEGAAKDVAPTQVTG